MFQVFTMFPVNILADFYGGAQQVAMLTTIGTLIGIILQIVISTFVGKIKSIKKVTAVIGAAALILCYLVAGLPHTSLGIWNVCYLLLNVVVTMYALVFLSIIAGQWFPTRKGTVMGIATIAYPFCNGVIGFFAQAAMGALYSGAASAFDAFLPSLRVLLLFRRPGIGTAAILERAPEKA